MSLNSSRVKNMSSGFQDTDTNVVQYQSAHIDVSHGCPLIFLTKFKKNGSDKNVKFCWQT